MASNYMPVLENVADEELAKTNSTVANYITFLNQADGGDNIAGLSAKIALQQSAAYFTSPAFIGADTARDEVGLLLKNVLGFAGNNLRNQIDVALRTALQNCESKHMTPQ